VEEAAGRGAEVATGGGVREDGLLEPTVVDGMAPGMKVWSEEVFAPVVGVAGYDSLEDGIAMANDSRYGLQAGVFTANITDALRAARRLHYGGVTINEAPTFRADQQPYGGVKASGNGREGPRYAVESMTELKNITIQLGGR
jgi:acyl-CoA reductase-like NAD-dependent aldehyde dehydrogenase